MEQNNTDDKEQETDKAKQMREFRAELILKIEMLNDFKTIRESDSLYYFDFDTYMYDSNGVAEVRKQLRKMAGEYFTIKLKNEVVEAIKDDTQIKNPNEFFNTPKEWINLKNGALNVLTREFIPRGHLDLTEIEDKIKSVWKESLKQEGKMKEMYQNQVEDLKRQRMEMIIKFHNEEIKKFGRFHFTTIIPVTYDPSKTCPKINEFFYKAQDGNEERITNLKELFGYCLLKDYPIKKLFIWYGESNTAKTTTSNLLTAFLGKSNRTTLSMEALQEDKFEKTKLKGKLANISGELSTTFIKDTSLLKQLTGRDSISERLMHTQMISEFENYAKMIFLANVIPDTYDNQKGFFERVKIMYFSHVFKVGVDLDDQILDKIITDDELSGLLNESLDALNNLLKRDRFIDDKDSENAKREYKEQADPIDAFVDNYLDIDLDAIDSAVGLTKAEVYDLFIRYCVYLKIEPPSENKFFRKLNSIFKQLDIHTDNNRRTPDGKTYYPGVFIKKKQE